MGSGQAMYEAALVVRTGGGLLLGLVGGTRDVANTSRAQNSYSIHSTAKHLPTHTHIHTHAHVNE